MTPKHATAPWRREELLIFDGDGLHVASVIDERYLGTDSTAEADADLIASAPDLLMALKSIASFPPTSNESAEGLKQLARNAIAKATGKKL